MGREYEIDDRACIVFAAAFYTKLFNSTSPTVCDAFEFAKADVKTQFGKEGFAGEEHKFRCLTNHKGEKCASNDLTLKPGIPLNVSNKVHIKNLPVRVPDLIGRANDCQKVLQVLDLHRLIWVDGIPGIGKSVLVKEITHLVYDRDVFEDGVLYMSLKD